MPIDPKFPADPFAVIFPDYRWRPATDGGGMVLAEAGAEFGSLLPPLVDQVRRGVSAWRESGYAGASGTTRSLLDWWFGRRHFGADGEEFRYYFAQREAVESVAWLYETKRVRTRYDLMPFDSTGRISGGMMPEEWPRFVVKMATGGGKTKVMSLLAAWSYFHRLYEPGSELSRNILLVAPNIIVLDRLCRDFGELRIFHADPVLPENGFGGRDWRSDFQMRAHRQDEVRAVNPAGNIFLTNIHRLFDSGAVPPTAEDDDATAYFLGPKPRDPKSGSGVDLGELVRGMDELLVMNDEAHHIHNEKMAWFKNIGDIHNRMVQRGKSLPLQLDFTATPKHDNGTIFPRTISDYPLAEAVRQGIVKSPVIPDRESASRLRDRKESALYSKRFADHILLGVTEWRKAHAACKRAGKKALLFVMTEDTATCDEVAAALGAQFPDLDGKILVIHTKDNGEIAEKGKARDLEELRKLREQANAIDGGESPYLAVVSVLMLREGWDVRNVTTIIGLRPYESKSRILPEQTLGRGLRRMFPGEDRGEKLSVVGTDAFMDFVRQVEKEGVELEEAGMGERTPPQAPLIVEVDRDNPNKNIAALDIEIPRLSPRLVRDYGRIAEMDPAKFSRGKIRLRDFPPSELREIVFRDILTGDVSHRTKLPEGGEADPTQITGYFARMAMRDMRLDGSAYPVVYEKTRDFIRDHLFESPVDLSAPVVCRNLAEDAAGEAVRDALRRAVNAALASETIGVESRGVLRVSAMRPFPAKPRERMSPAKSVLNFVVGDNALEVRFADFLERCPDVAAFAKNYFAVGFRLEYVKADGELSNYHPDFLVKNSGGEVYVVETKGRQDVDDAPKFARLSQWCADVNAQGGAKFHPLFVSEEKFDRARAKTFADLSALFANDRPFEGRSDD